MTGETVVRQRAASTTDRNGNTVTDWSDPDRLTVDGCALAPLKADETTDAGRQGVVIGWTLYAPPGADIQAVDRIEARGRVLKVDGEPAVWRNPHTGRTAGIEVVLRAVEG